MVLGLLTALFWGGSDFLIRLLERRIPLRSALLWTQGSASVAMLGVSLASGHLPYAGLDPSILPMLVVTAAASAVGLGLIFFAFQNGRVAVVAPLTGSYAIVATLIGLLTGTEALSAPLLGSILLISLGALLVMMHDEEGHGHRPGVGATAALASALVSGIAIWLTVAFLLPKVAVTDILLTNFALLALAALLWGAPKAIRRPADGATSLLLAGIAIGTVAGYGAYNTGLSRNGIAVVSVLSTLSSAITVFLGAVVAKEKVGRVQRLGIAIIVLGLPLLAAVREIGVPPQWNQTLGSTYRPTPLSRSIATGARPPAIG
jgi:drug/metabolite transporter (DMT)-like permease